MSKQHRTKLIKRLEEQMEATTDPQLKLDLAKQITKLMPRPRQRKAKAKEVAPSSKGTSLLTKKNGNGVDWLSPQKKLIHFVVVEFEKRRKEHKQRTGQELTEVEKNALLTEASESIHGQLTAEDRALLDAEEAEKQEQQVG